MTTCGVCSVKFIARDQWFAVAAGDAKGWVHVFNNSCFEGNKKVVEAFEAHPDKYVDSLAVHPTYPILLSSSCEDSIIKRWDRDQGWACTRIFKGHTSGVRCLAFNPSNTNNFASIDVDDVSQVWDINSSNAITQSPVEPEKVDCFFSDRRHRHFMICSDDDQIKTAEIWDAQTQDHLQTLGVFTRTRTILKNDIRVKDRDRGNSSERKSGHGSEIPAPRHIKAKAKNKGKKDSGAKGNHGGRGDHDNNATSASGRGGTDAGAGNPGNQGQMGGAPTSKDSGAKENHGGTGNHANNATGASERDDAGAGNQGQMGSAQTSKDSGAKENHGGRDDHANNATGAGNPGNQGQMGGAPTSIPIGHPNSSMPPRHQPPPPLPPVTPTPGLLNYQPGPYHSIFSDENPNSCSVM